MPQLSHALVALVLLLVVGCDSSEPDAARSQPDADLQLELGETGISDGLAITFETITEDSRCPKGVECVWAGEAHVRLVVDGTSETVRAADPELAPDAFIQRGDVVLRALELAPYPGTPEAERGDPPMVFLVTETSSD